MRLIQLLVLTQADVVRMLDPLELIASLREAFTQLSAGRAAMPPRIAAVVPGRGLLACMPAYLPSGDGLGLEVKLVSVFPDNHRRNLPSHQAVIMLFDDETGSPMALLDATHITAARTAAATALASGLLARPDARTLAILGAGVQGRAHLEAMTAAGDYERVLVASRNTAHAEALAETHQRASAASFEDAVRAADVICACTDSPQPVLAGDWVRPGTHVSSVGFSAGGPELDAVTIARALDAGVLAVESRQCFQPYPAGAHELQNIDPALAVELGELVSGARPGRTHPAQVTVYKSAGIAVEDAAAAALVYRRATEHGAGQILTL